MGRVELFSTRDVNVYRWIANKNSGTGGFQRLPAGRRPRRAGNRIARFRHLQKLKVYVHDRRGNRTVCFRVDLYNALSYLSRRSTGAAAVKKSAVLEIKGQKRRQCSLSFSSSRTVLLLNGKNLGFSLEFLASPLSSLLMHASSISAVEIHGALCVTRMPLVIARAVKKGRARARARKDRPRHISRVRGLQTTRVARFIS